MIRLLHNVQIDWLAQRRFWLVASALLMLAGLGSAVARQAMGGGSDAFNLGVDFKGGTVMTARFNQRPSDDAIRSALEQKGVRNAIVQSTERPSEVLIRVPEQGGGEQAQSQAQVDVGRALAGEALTALGPETGATIERTEAVGPVAGRALRNQAIAVTLLALVGVLLYIGSRFEWTYGAAAVITVFHDVLVTLGIFSIMQWEIDLTVIAALLTLVGFSVNDTIVTFDRIRENLRLHRRTSLYDLTNEAINQTLSRTVITAGLVFFSVLALVVFGGDVLRGFSLALFIGIIVGTYSTIAIATPLMVWFQQRLEPAKRATVTREGGAPASGNATTSTRNAKAKAAARGSQRTARS
ncbi:MAG TPA: protein translocase subunit SecF [Pyrinomonadaceae bacterium]|jgi:preprotein translocase subunit SecF|nr:protein translocase subunit SecF [Pyrinomonadaceae bacterium]